MSTCGLSAWSFEGAMESVSDFFSGFCSGSNDDGSMSSSDFDSHDKTSESSVAVGAMASYGADLGGKYAGWRGMLVGAAAGAATGYFGGNYLSSCWSETQAAKGNSNSEAVVADPGSVSDTSSKSNPLNGTKYTDKVKDDMKPDPKTGEKDYHGFPEEVENYAEEGTVETITGGDGKERKKSRSGR
jgi:hypothetical protein